MFATKILGRALIARLPGQKKVSPRRRSKALQRMFWLAAGCALASAQVADAVDLTYIWQAASDKSYADANLQNNWGFLPGVYPLGGIVIFGNASPVHTVVYDVGGAYVGQLYFDAAYTLQVPNQAAHELYLSDGGSASVQVTGPYSVTIQPAVHVVDTTTFTISSGGSLTLTSGIQDQGGVIKDGSGTMTVKGRCDWLGPTTVLAGTLDLTLGGPNLDNGNYVTGGVTVSGGIFKSALYTRTAPLSVAAAGTAILSGSNLTINTVTNAGLINFTNTSGSITLPGGISAGTFNFSAGMSTSTFSGGTANFLSSGLYTITTLTGGTIADGGQLHVGGGSFSGSISGAGSLTKFGSDTFTLLSTNTYAGGTTLSGGVLAASAMTNLGKGALTFDGGTLQFTSAFDPSANGSIALKSGGGTFDTKAGSVLVAGNITGSGALTKVGSGTLLFTGPKSYTGDTTVAEGTLQLGDGIAKSATLAGKIIDNSAVDFAIPVAQTYAGVISGKGTVTASGPGTLILTGANTYAGQTTVAGGTVQLNHPGAPALSGDAQITGGTLQLLASQQIVNTANLAVSTGGTFDLNGQTQEIKTLLQNGGTTTTGVGALTVTGDLGAGAGAVLTGGHLTVGAGGTLTTTAGVQLASAGADISGTLTSGGMLNLSNGSLMVVNSGGTVNPNAGIVSTGSSITINTGGTITVADNQTLSVAGGSLGVSGTVNAAVGGSGGNGATVNTDANATLHVLAGGMLLAGNLNLGGASTFDAGTVVATNLATTPTANLSVNNGASVQANTLTLAGTTTFYGGNIVAANLITAPTATLNVNAGTVVKANAMDLSGTVVAPDLSTTAGQTLTVRSGASVQATTMNLAGTTTVEAGAQVSPSVVTFSSGSVLNAAINGSSVGPRTQISAQLASIAGSLNVTLGSSPDGYTLQRGDRVPIIITSGGAAIGYFSQTSMPTVPGKPELFLTADYTNKDVSVVVHQTQDVVLAFGSIIPRKWVPLKNSIGYENYTSESGFTLPAIMSSSLQESILQQVQSIFQAAGVQHLNISIGAPRDDAKVVYFANPLPKDNFSGQLAGQAYTGVNNLNHYLGGAAAIFYDPTVLCSDGSNAPLNWAAVVAHEIGHTLGLVHVIGADAHEVMNYNWATTEGFENAVTATFGGGATSNPVYLLRRYVDGVSDPELRAQGIYPGTRDSAGNELSLFSNNATFSSSAEQTLYNVTVVANPGDDAQQTLASYDQISLSQLGALGITFDDYSNIQLWASSTPGGDSDLFLSTSNPGSDWQGGISLGLGSQAGFLEQYDPTTGSYISLSSLSFTTTAVPEPGTLAVLALGAVGLLSRRRR